MCNAISNWAVCYSTDVTLNATEVSVALEPLSVEQTRRQYSASSQRLRSAGCHQLFVPRHRRSMFGRRAFSVAGPAAWNTLPDYLRDPSCSADVFRRT